MNDGKDEEETSEFLAINSLRELIKNVEKEKNGKRAAKDFMQELRNEQNLLGWNHFTVLFETGQELKIDNHGGGIRLKTETTGELREPLSTETDFPILNELSVRKIVKYYEIGE